MFCAMGPRHTVSVLGRPLFAVGRHGSGSCGRTAVIAVDSTLTPPRRYQSSKSSQQSPLKGRTQHHISSSAPSKTSQTATRFSTLSSIVLGEMDPSNGQGGKANTWIGSAGAGGIDLRSDTMTTPTASMLAAIQSGTLLDDVFQEDPTTVALEAHCAALTGKDAGLFVLSGTMGNQLALRSLLTQPPHGVICDHRSHIVKYEAGGVSSLTGAMVKAVVPSNGIYLTLEDIKTNVHLDDNVHTCPTRVISLENTLNGMVMPLEEAQQISAFARENGLKVHCDGARLWEAVASGAGSLTEFAACFDTVSLCFSKGLGAPIGSVLVGDKSVIKHARWVRKSIGGGLRQSGVVTAAARVAVDETFGEGPNGEGGVLRETHVLAKEVAKMWTDLGGKLFHPVHTNMVWLDLDDAKCSPDRIHALGTEAGLKLHYNRLVIHYQIYQNREVVVPKLGRIFQTIFDEKLKNIAGFEGENGERSMYQTQ